MIAITLHFLPLLAAIPAVPIRPQTLFLVLNLAWAGYEVYLNLRRRAADGGGRDAGTLGLLWRVLGLAIAAAVFVASSGYGRLPAGWMELRDAFPDAYPAYAARTGRLLPLKLV